MFGKIILCLGAKKKNYTTVWYLNDVLPSMSLIYMKILLELISKGFSRKVYFVTNNSASLMYKKVATMILEK